jgi:hypothetical protein
MGTESARPRGRCGQFWLKEKATGMVHKTIDTAHLDEILLLGEDLHIFTFSLMLISSAMIFLHVVVSRGADVLR